MSKISIVKEAAEKAIAAELERTAHLLRKADILAAGTIIVTGFQLLDANNVLGAHWTDILYYLSLAVLSVALLFAFRGMGGKGYASYPRGNKLWETLKPENIPEEAAQEALVHMLLQTREQNARLNDAKVNALSWCGWLLFIGFLLVVASQLLNAILNSPVYISPPG
ncbi:MAG TPA: hypothetical protein VMH30_05900 [Verrucomicrobiae bacterium]|nr:hypothetical protein [Verrucomicrobiae bacterium]